MMDATREKRLRIMKEFGPKWVVLRLKNGAGVRDVTLI